MPCCAFVACIVGQFLLALGAARRVLFGPGANHRLERNLAVEWRLGAPAETLAVVEPRPWWPTRRALVVAVAVEMILFGAGVYGFLEHRGHTSGTGHAAHVHRTQTVDHAAGVETAHSSER